MEVILKADRDYIGKVEDYTPRKNNISNIDPSTIGMVISLYEHRGSIEVTEALVDIVNMDCSNLLVDRVCKKSAESIAEEIKDFLNRKN